MNPEEKQLLEKAVRLSEENNIILRKMRRSAMWGTTFRIFYWTIIIGLSIGAFYFLEPYAKTVAKSYTQFRSDLDTFQHFIK